MIKRLFLSLFLVACAFAQDAPKEAPKPAAPAVDSWGDDFSGESLDQSKWEPFSFEGGRGGTLKVEKGQLKMRSVNGSRSGVRSQAAFSSDRYIVEATLAKVGPAMPDPMQTGQSPIGNAILCLMFDTSGRNRIEWIFTSEGTMEAWYVEDGRGERLDNRKMATKEKTPTLGIVRRGDDFSFMLNGEEGLRKTLRGAPKTFHVMLYGYSSSENNWDSVLVRTVKQP